MLLEGITLHSVMPQAVVARRVLRSRTGWIMLEWLRALHPGLALDGAEDLVNGRKLQWGEVGVCPENSELALRGVRVHQFVGVMPPAMSLSHV